MPPLQRILSKPLFFVKTTSCHPPSPSSAVGRKRPNSNQYLRALGRSLNVSTTTSYCWWNLRFIKPFKNNGINYQSTGERRISQPSTVPSRSNNFRHHWKRMTERSMDINVANKRIQFLKCREDIFSSERIAIPQSRTNSWSWESLFWREAETTRKKNVQTLHLERRWKKKVLQDIVTCNIL